MITSKKVYEEIESRLINEESLTSDQASLDKMLTESILGAIRMTTGKDIWQYKVTNKYTKDNSGNVTGSWIQISRTPPASVPKLYEFVDFKCYYDFKDPCYLYYAFGRGSGEFKSKTFKASQANIKQTLISVFKSLYFTNGVPNLDKVIDTSKLK